MPKPLNSTKRCKLFNKLSVSVWKEVLDYHQYNCEASEIGITKYIIKEMTKFSSDVINNFHLYVKPGYKESLYGSDLDLFVGIGSGEYRWFALQAKLLKSNGLYTTMLDGYSSKNPSYQWEKLTLLEAVSGCKSFYLLYNGRNDYLYSEEDRCGEVFDQRYFGCSIVETPVIREICLRKEDGKYISPSFLDFHPDHAQPWRALVCCSHERVGEAATYTITDIRESLSDYKLLSPGELDFGDFPQIKEANQTIKDVARSSNALSIKQASKRANWSPEYRIVISPTSETTKNA